MSWVIPVLTGWLILYTGLGEGPRPTDAADRGSVQDLSFWGYACSHALDCFNDCRGLTRPQSAAVITHS